MTDGMMASRWFPLRNALAAGALALALSACGGDAGQTERENRDPAVTAALSDPIMADPDLTSQNRADSALSGGGPATAEVPPDKRGPEEAERARLAARELLGGGPVPPAPPPAGQQAESRLARAVTLEAVAVALDMGGKGCAKSVGYGFGWVTLLPGALPVYPRGHARVAAGSDAPGCKLRLVRFVTPVSAGEVADFYFASARKAGLSPEVRREGGDLVVQGGKGAGRFAVYLRDAGNGLTEVDLATSGL
ncbi:MAG: hypothetical protein J0L50_14570 [Sphingomonadales bacterium]|nr:hypothetical protein [Sphingomonadales bacterium]